jgi:uncharacterized protein (DUF2237 family)
MAAECNDRLGRRGEGKGHGNAEGRHRVVLRATHEAALAYFSLADLKRFAVDLA